MGPCDRICGNPACVIIDIGSDDPRSDHAEEKEEARPVDFFQLFNHKISAFSVDAFPAEPAVLPRFKLERPFLTMVNAVPLDWMSNQLKN
jgi:hypothetical protein